jgi:uncharacterized protein (TIGR02145 family)
MATELEISKLMSMCVHGAVIRKSLLTAIVLLAGGFFIIDCNKSSTDSMVANTPPSAAFEVIPESGFTQGYFIFDAFTCKDLQDSTTDLMVRYDWENDGAWDTDYLTNQLITHQYVTAGTIKIKLEVRDKGNLTDTTTRSITVSTAMHDTGTVTDIDGNIYQTVKIGNQWWMAENLKTTHYRNGEAIFNLTDSHIWHSIWYAAYCDYENNPAISAVYGRLYNWYAAKDIRGIAPEGWHVPSDAEWKALEIYMGMSQVALDSSGRRGSYEGAELKEAGTTHWIAPNTGAIDIYGFSALPGGIRNASDYDLGYRAAFWTSKLESDSGAWCRYIRYKDTGITRSADLKTNGYSVRCVKN